MDKIVYKETSNKYHSSTNHRHKPSFNELADVRKELRQRRKTFLGSYRSLKEIVSISGKVNEEYIKQFCNFLSYRTSLLWSDKIFDAETFCHRFFTLSVHALAFNDLADECIDDVIQLAECFVRSKSVFVTVMEQLLAPEMISELHDFVNEYDEEIFTPYFEDAVLGAVAIYTGTLKEPIVNADKQKLKEQNNE